MERVYGLVIMVIRVGTHGVLTAWCLRLPSLCKVFELLECCWRKKVAWHEV